MGFILFFMLIVIQIPIFDIRRFLEKTNEPINKPNWKFIEDSDVQSKFIRSVGPIDIRSAEANTLSEKYYSIAKRGIRFIQLPILKVSDNGNEISIPLRPLFRRFFFDGTVCGKYEIGFSFELEEQQHITSQSFIDFLSSLSECKVYIPIPFKTKVESTLFACGRYLAEQYLYATTHRKNINHDQVQGVYPGFPCIYLEKLDNELINGNIISDSVFIKQPKGVSIGLTKLKINNKLIKVWYSTVDPGMKATIAREIRIAILRLNVFREALHFVLKKIEENKILPNPRSNESEELQSFFKDCFGQYLRKVPDKLSDSDFETIAIQIEDKFAVVNREQLEYNLRKVIDIRGNYFNSIKNYLEKMESSKNDTMNEKVIQEITISGGTNSFVVSGGDTNQILHNPMKIAQLPEESKQHKEKILFVSANPPGFDILKTDGEFKLMNKILKGSEHFELLNPIFEIALDELLSEMNVNPAIVHFAGHGEVDGIFITKNDGSFQITEEVLKSLFNEHKTSTLLLVLNACYTASMAKEISALGIYVIGMNNKIKDNASKCFSKGLYIRLGEGEKIESAFNYGITMLIAEHPDMQEVPELWKGGILIARKGTT